MTQRDDDVMSAGTSITCHRRDSSVSALTSQNATPELEEFLRSCNLNPKDPIIVGAIIRTVINIKERTKETQKRRAIVAEESAKLRQQQLEAQAKTKADEKKADEERRALLKKLADAQRAENERKADELKAKVKAKNKRPDELEKAKREILEKHEQPLKLAKVGWITPEQVV